MKKNQVLQLLLVLQLLVVIVLVVSFWDRYRGVSVQQTNGTQQNTCNTNTCNTCNTCQTQNVCSTCNAVSQAAHTHDLDLHVIQDAVDSAVAGSLGSEVQTVIARELHAKLQSELQSQIQTEIRSNLQGQLQSEIQSQLQDTIAGHVQSAVADQIQGAVSQEIQNAIAKQITSEVQTAVNTALDGAIKDVEDRFLSNSVAGGQQNVDAARLQNSRAYDPNAPEVTAEVSEGEFDSVPDAVKALAAEQTDEFDALAGRTSNFRSTENSFETSSDILFEGSALKFKPETSEDVLTVFRGGAVDDDGVFIFKRFGEDHTILAVNSPPSTAPFYGKESTVALVRGDEPNVEVVDFYNQDYPEAGVRQAGIRVIKEVGPDVTKSEWLPFAIDYAAHDTQTKETTEYEVLKVMPPSPQANVQANVQINGYMQIDVVNKPGAPPLEDCNAIEEHGRMKVDPREGVSLLYICTSDGWVAK